MPALTEPQRHARRVVRRLAADYPDAECELNFSSPLELLIATILSAQCTDVRVNLVTKDLFQQYRTAADYAQAPIGKLEKAVQSTGFFRNKAKNIKACAQGLVEKHGGEVPRSLEELVQLPGVGRKTANVVLGTAFDLATGVVVDTHVARLSHRLGLCAERKNAERIERDLMELLPRKEWVAFSHRMIWHGRRVCNARKPHCDTCSMSKFCPRIGVTAIASES